LKGERTHCGFEKTAAAGHACCLEDPARFDEIVLGFLQERGFAK
jgi:pimeloyl-ACP methyl ester carboxylesterase